VVIALFDQAGGLSSERTDNILRIVRFIHARGNRLPDHHFDHQGDAFRRKVWPSVD